MVADIEGDGVGVGCTFPVEGCAMDEVCLTVLDIANDDDALDGARLELGTTTLEGSKMALELVTKMLELPTTGMDVGMAELTGATKLLRVVLEVGDCPVGEGDVAEELCALRLADVDGDEIMSELIGATMLVAVCVGDADALAVCRGALVEALSVLAGVVLALVAAPGEEDESSAELIGATMLADCDSDVVGVGDEVELVVLRTAVLLEAGAGEDSAEAELACADDVRVDVNATMLEASSAMLELAICKLELNAIGTDVNIAELTGTAKLLLLLLRLLLVV